jgi:transposase-like protein
MEVPATLLEAIKAFKDPAVAHAYFAEIRWPNGIACPRQGCGSADVRAITGPRPRWYCRECKREFTAKVGTIFEDSPIGFDKWLPAIWLLSASRNGISSCELARSLGVTQKTAWFMLHRIRLGFASPTYERLTGEVEADETYIGGKRRHRGQREPDGSWKHEGPKKEKAIVMGIMQRDGDVRAYVVPNDKANTLLPKIYDNVDPNANIYTDAHRAYWDLQYTHHHEYVNHMERYVEGHVHTNHIENFWRCLKRTLGGTYINVRPFHLARYVDAQAFRFNRRDEKDGPRFIDGAKGADGKRLTYKELTASHPRWRLRPGRAARARRRKAEPPITGVSDRPPSP